MSCVNIKEWFGEKFSHLHPKLQALHTCGGQLSGQVKISYGKGVSGFIGKRLAKKMKLPNAGNHLLTINITHDHEGMHWNRHFNDDSIIQSLFKPVGDIDHGYWVEKTGPLLMKLTVDIHEGDWYWRCLRIKLFGIPIPQWLMPKTQAYKRIEEGQYRFYVGFSLPILGHLVSYSGRLN